MKKSEKIYAVIKDLWSFAHKYCDVLDSNTPIDWETALDEYKDMTDGKIINDNDIDILRKKLFVDIFRCLDNMDIQLRKELKNGGKLEKR